MPCAHSKPKNPYPRFKASLYKCVLELGTPAEIERVLYYVQKAAYSFPMPNNYVNAIRGLYLDLADAFNDAVETFPGGANPPADAQLFALDPSVEQVFHFLGKYRFVPI